MGYVMTGSRVWAHAPELHDDLFALLDRAAQRAGLGVRERGILVTACASTLGDSYCSMAWGYKLASVAGADLAADVLRGVDDGLTDRERALAAWARRLAADANGTSTADVEALRSAGYDDTQLLAITAYVALRIAFSTVNDAPGRPAGARARGTGTGGGPDGGDVRPPDEELSGDEGNRTPNPRLAKSTEGWFGAVGCDLKPVLTRTFTVELCRTTLGASGRFADYLRTVCGLDASQQWPPTLPSYLSDRRLPRTQLHGVSDGPASGRSCRSPATPGKGMAPSGGVSDGGIARSASSCWWRTEPPTRSSHSPGNASRELVQARQPDKDRSRRG
jgi:alkylhydroperoxidase family enzyme